MLCTFYRSMGLWQVLKSQFLCHLIICYVFLVSGLIVNVVQICTLPLWLLNKQLARRVNIRLGYCISSRKFCSDERVRPAKDLIVFNGPQRWWLLWSGGLGLNARFTQNRRATSFMERRTPSWFLTTGLRWISCVGGPSVRGSVFLG